MGRTLSEKKNEDTELIFEKKPWKFCMLNLKKERKQPQ